MFSLPSSPARSFRGSLASVIGLLLVVYFGSYALNGTRGVLALSNLDEQITRATLILSEQEVEKARLAARVAHLSTATLDADLLDEQARRMLNRVHPDEYIIMRGLADTQR